MSILKRGKLGHNLPAQAGASVLAALVLLAILGGVMIGLNALNPQAGLSVTTSSEAASAAGAVANVNSASQAAATGEIETATVDPVVQRVPQTVVTSIPPLDGVDTLALLYMSGGAKKAQALYVTVCPTDEAMQKGKLRSQQQSQFTKDFANYVRTKLATPPNDFGNAQGDRCYKASDGKLRPKPNQPWKAWNVTCEKTAAAVIKPSTGTGDDPVRIQNASFEADDAQIEEVRNDLTNSAYRCTAAQGNRAGAIPTPNSTAVNDLARRLANATTNDERNKILAEARAAGVDQTTLKGAFEETVRTDIRDRTDKLDVVKSKIDDFAKDGVTAETCANGTAPRTLPGAPLGAAAELAVSGSGSPCDQLSSLTTQQKQLEDEISKRNAMLANSATILQPLGGPPSTQTCLGGGTCINPGTVSTSDYYCMKSANPVVVTPVPAGTPFPSNCCNGTNSSGLSQCSPGTVAPGYTQNPNGTFSPTSNGQQCQQGYICQGNVLYYRTSNIYGNNTQCMMQPFQQCQYGCAQPYGGALGTTGSTGGTSFMQYIPLLTSMMSMFSGQNNNGMNGMSTLGQSTQCSPYPQQQTQQQNPYGTGTNGQPCYQQQPPQPDPASCTSGSWQPQAAQGNGCVTGWQCVPRRTDNPSSPQAPKATLSCQPKTADVGMQISLTYACDNSTSASGNGFSVGSTTGTTTATVQTPAQGVSSVTYTLTCKNDQNQTASAQCKIDVVRPLIVLVANPKVVKNGESSSIGWITTGMQSCKISNADFKDWTAQQANNTNVNGALQSPAITKNTLFVLDCNSLAGETKEATVQVNVQ